LERRALQQASLLRQASFPELRVLQSVLLLALARQQV
jgi:hypothetical protein